MTIISSNTELPSISEEIELHTEDDQGLVGERALPLEET